jgi:transcriptional antiterminator NusG
MMNEESSPSFGSGPTFVGETDSKALPAGGEACWDLQLDSGGAKKVGLTVIVITGPDENDSPEWGVEITDSVDRELWSNAAPADVEIEIDGPRPKELKLKVTAPKGARFGDEVEVTLVATTPGGTGTIHYSATARQSVLALKTSIGHERAVADSLGSKAKGGKSGIFAILSPTNLRGYILVEGMNTDRLRETARGVRKARGFVEGETEMDEIDHFLTPKPLVSGIMEGDVVELISGPFKGEKARVQQIDESKEEITVELFEAMVPIPVTIRGDHVRVIEKER